MCFSDKKKIQHPIQNQKQFQFQNQQKIMNILKITTPTGILYCTK